MLRFIAALIGDDAIEEALAGVSAIGYALAGAYIVLAIVIAWVLLRAQLAGLLPTIGHLVTTIARF